MAAETISGGRSGFDYRWLSLGVTTVGSFMSLLDATMVNIGLHTIIDEFHADVQDGQWVITGYTLALSIVIPVSGFLAERIGMKRLYMMTMAMFIMTSVLSGLAWNLQSLIFFRVLQGLGGGMLQPLGQAIVYSIVTPLERPRFMAMLGLPALVGPLLGPTIGGYLVEYASWRAMFTINLPIGLAGLTLAWLLLKEVAPRRGARLDLPGFLLSAIAFPSLMLGFTLGSSDGWTALETEICLVVGASCLIGWIVVELVQREPMLDLRLFVHPTFRVSVILTFVMMLSLFGTQFLLPLFLQTVQGLGPLESGLILVPQGIASFASLTLSGRLYNRVGPRVLVIGGLAVMAVATWQLGHLGVGTSHAFISFLAMLRGFAIGCCFMPNQTAAFNTVPREKIARAPALYNGLQRLFSSFSTAFLATILNSRTIFHYNVIATAMTPDRPAVQELAARVRMALALNGPPSRADQARVTAAMVRLSVRQSAAVMAFNDAFLTLTGACAVAACLGCCWMTHCSERRSGVVEGMARHRSRRRAPGIERVEPWCP
ncbi:MAG: DHA2 family efflux MFS transporter permease subunit [Chloroflexota bacterium]